MSRILVTVITTFLAVPALADIASESGAAVTFEPENAADLAMVLNRLVGDEAAEEEALLLPPPPRPKR